MGVSLVKPDDLQGYTELRRWLGSLKQRGQLSAWGDAVRWYIEHDLFFLLNDVLTDGKTLNTETGQPLFFHPFYLDWCRQVEWQIAHGGGSDHSARRSGKSTLRTKAANIQRMVRYPDSAGCIFSYQRRASKKHFRLIKDEIEGNELLRVVCDDIFFWDPKSAAKNGETVWSMEDGLRVKRAITRREQTLEYNAFVDGTPTGGGYDWLDFDDSEDHKIFSSDEQLEKAHKTYDSTINLLTPAVLPRPVTLFTNTFYGDRGLAKRVYDHYREIDPRKVRTHPAEDLEQPGPGPLGGTPRYPFTLERLQRTFDELRGDKREYAIQFCCSFLAGEHRRLSPEWLLRYEEHPDQAGKGRNIYVCIDPSRGRSDPMAIWVWGLGADRKAAWVDASLKRLDPALPPFYDEIFMLVAKWTSLGARLVEVRVENFGQATYDSQIARELAQRGFYVKVIPCQDNMRSGLFATGKRDREFERWAGPAARGEVLIPRPVKEGGPGLVRPDEKGRLRDLVSYFLNKEWEKFPKPLTDNLLDAGSLLWEPEERMGAPLQYPRPKVRRRRQGRQGGTGFSHMSAG